MFNPLLSSIPFHKATRQSNFASKNQERSTLEI